MSSEHRADIGALLDTAGLKRTRGRLAVLDVLGRSKRPLTIEEIHEALSESVHVVTLYRMLRQLVDAGIVYQADLRTGKAHYELQQEHHHHLTCRQCGRQEEFSVCLTPLFDDIVKKSKQFDEVSSHTFELFGLCSTCAKEHTAHE